MRAEIGENGTHQRPGTAELTGGPKGSVLGKFLAAIEREVCTLPESTLSTLHAAAVGGTSLGHLLRLGAAVADVREDEVLKGLNELLAPDIVRRADSSHRYSFRHPIVAAVVAAA